MESIRVRGMDQWLPYFILGEIYTKRHEPDNAALAFTDALDRAIDPEYLDFIRDRIDQQR